MQDRFKFRHWDSEINEMRYGDIQLGFDGKPFVIGRNGPSEIPKVYDIDNVITLQCTGLKDKNGKLIFEGDIVEIDSDTLAKILWSDDLARFIIVYENIQTDFDNYFGYELEVIGNIYESEIPDGQSPVSECEVDGNEVKSTTAASAKEFQDNPELLKEVQK